MSAWILGAGLSNDARAEALKDDPDFRRATGNVRLAVSATEAALTCSLRDFGARAAIVVATGHGELEPTSQFLQELGRNNVARPLLFQNSLHNTVAGFLALRFGVVGPVMTVSDGAFSGEDALDVAQTLLEAGDADVALVVGVDSVPRLLSDLLPSLYPPGFRPVDQAAALVLANEKGKRARKPDESLVRLGEIARNFRSAPGAAWPEDFFDANAIAVIARAVLAPPTSADIPLALPKPDGTSSSVHLHRGSR